MAKEKQVERVAEKAPEPVAEAGGHQVEKAAGPSEETPGRTASTARKKAKKKAPKSALSKLRAALPALVLIGLAVAFVARVPVGNLSSFGPELFSVICPIGALSTLLASKSFIAHAVISLVLVALFVALFGRAFCSWVCSVPLVQRILGVDPTGKKRAQGKARREAARAKRASGQVAGDAAGTGAAADVWVAAAKAAAVSGSWSADAPAVPGCGSGDACAAGPSGSCATCSERRQRLLDSRHWVLGGSLLSAAIFGFPVFCVVCPVGLTFALVFLIVRLFTGSVSWALLVVPLVLVVELVFLRRWCHQFCPIGGLMALLAKFNKTFVPTIDKTRCIEATTGHTCGRCASVCPERIDLRDLAAGERGINECVKCRQCVDACPKGAITMPFLPKKPGGAEPVTVDGGAPRT